jgi:hypothetical protein
VSQPRGQVGLADPALRAPLALSPGVPGRAARHDPGRAAAPRHRGAVPSLDLAGGAHRPGKAQGQGACNGQALALSPSTAPLAAAAWSRCGAGTANAAGAEPSATTTVEEMSSPRSGGRWASDSWERHQGDRHGQVIDPYGHRWEISQHLRDVPHPRRSPDRGSDVRRRNGLTTPVSRLSATIQQVALRRTTAPCPAVSLSRVGAMPGMAAEGVVMWCGWYGMQGVRVQIPSALPGTTRLWCGRKGWRRGPRFH